jgi:hypothetical protein
LSEIQQVYEILMRIDVILNGINVKSKEIQQQAPQLRENLQNLRTLERIAVRYLSIVRRMGLPDDVNAAITALSKMIVIARMAQMALTSLSTGGLSGIAIGVAGMFMTGMAATDFAMSVGE